MNHRVAGGVVALLCLTACIVVTSAGAAPTRPTERVSPPPKVNPQAVVWRTPRPPAKPQAGDVWVNPTDGTEMVWVAPGKFILGTSSAQINAWIKEWPADKAALFEDEQPQCSVNMPGYWIGRTAVTNAQYQRFVRATRHRAPQHWKAGRFPAGLGNSPAMFVAWQDARAYCEWAAGQLPTELQWEKAARGTDGRVFPWENRWDRSRCCNNYSTKTPRPAPVGSYRGDFSPYGCFDMAGNVSQWCADWYDRHAYQRYAKGNLSPPKSGQGRVLRGASWSGLYPADFRCAHRDWLGPGGRYDSIGFRCARAAAP